MSRHFFKVFSVFAVMALFIGCEQLPTPISKSGSGQEMIRPAEQPDIQLRNGHAGEMVIADRASGTISVIDVSKDEVMGTHALPEGDNPAEPMYVVYDFRTHTVFVGDRGNNRVVAFDADDYSVKAMIPAGNGVFHMWADPRGKQLWVNNDIDKTITIIDPTRYSVVHTLSMPEDLAADGGKPHDVILDPTSRLAYVSILGLSGDSDYVVQYNTRNFLEMGRTAVGKDPHLSLTQKNKLLYVPCQNSDAVYILNRYSMEVEKILDVPGAHGAGMTLRGRTFYTTNLPGGGPEGLWTIDVRTNMVLAHTDAPTAIPHNIALTPDGSKLYVTHSGGTVNTVSVFKIERGEQVPEYVTSVTVGFNPFGLAYAR